VGDNTEVVVCVIPICDEYINDLFAVFPRHEAVFKKGNKGKFNPYLERGHSVWQYTENSKMVLLYLKKSLESIPQQSSVAEPLCQPLSLPRTTASGHQGCASWLPMQEVSDPQQGSWPVATSWLELLSDSWSWLTLYHRLHLS
jgi:hypothetical protein